MYIYTTNSIAISRSNILSFLWIHNIMSIPLLWPGFEILSLTVYLYSLDTYSCNVTSQIPRDKCRQNNEILPFCFANARLPLTERLLRKQITSWHGFSPNSHACVCLLGDNNMHAPVWSHVPCMGIKQSNSKLHFLVFTMSLVD